MSPSKKEGNQKARIIWTALRANQGSGDAQYSEEHLLNYITDYTFLGSGNRVKS